MITFGAGPGNVSSTLGALIARVEDTLPQMVRKVTTLPHTSDGAVGPGAVGPGAVGPGAVGPGAVGPGAVGPGAVGPHGALGGGRKSVLRVGYTPNYHSNPENVFRKL